MDNLKVLKQVLDPHDDIVRAGVEGNLVFFVGAGASMLLGLPSWYGFAANALEQLREKDCLNYAECEQLKTLDPKKQLSIARLIAKEKDIHLDLTAQFRKTSETSSIYETLNSIGCSCVTTNYDEFLKPSFDLAVDGSITPKSIKRYYDKEEIFSNLLDEPGNVIHLHGSICKPETMIVTTKDYLEHYDHENIKTFLSNMFCKKTVLFLGYGLEELEILEHILRRGEVRPEEHRRHFLIQGFFSSEQPLYQNLAMYYEKSFGVELMGYIRDHNDYKQLEDIMYSWIPKLVINKPPLASDYEFMSEVLDD